MRAALFLLCLASGASSAASPEEAMRAAKPVGLWLFGGSKPQPAFEAVGKANINAEGPRPPEFPGFNEDNHAAQFHGKGSRLVVQDPGAGSAFDFAAGDAITLEAWVNSEQIPAGLNHYIIGKGRTWPDGARLENQNWALRLLGRKGGTHVTFLFQTQGADGKARNHRWVSQQPFDPARGWHHVAVAYQFGKPESLLAVVDGAVVPGGWDFNGATVESPVPNDEPVWIGSSMGGNEESSFRGRLDAVAVYRSLIPAEALKARWQAEPGQPVRIVPPEFPDQLPPGKVLVEIHPGAGEQKKWPNPAPGATETYETTALAFTRLPQAYDEYGIRTDFAPAVMLRGFARIELPAGEHRVLLRGRGATRLWVNGSLLGSTRFAVFRGDGHTPMSAIPEPVIPGARRVPFGDAEETFALSSEGGMHELVFDVLAGSKNMRMETGESLAAIQLNGAGPFVILSPGGAGVPLTDEAWPAFAAACEESLTQRDTARRRMLAASHDETWKHRHKLARQEVANLALNVPEGVGTEIDRFITARVAAIAAAPAQQQGVVDFQRDIKPLLNDHCFRCHAEKQKGGLRLDEREPALKGGESGHAAITPGKPEHSHLLKLVRSEDEDSRMPPNGKPLTAAQIKLLETWIAEGAQWSDAPSAPVKIPPDAGDAAFIRRVYLNTIGIAPGAEEVRAFHADTVQDKRARLIDRLLDDDRFAGHWVSYWQDVLAENPNILKPELNNTGPFRFWIYESLLDHKPLDRFVTELIMMRGSKLGGGPAGFGIASQNDVPMAEKANVIANAFLGVEMKCARCHDAPYHQSTQEQLFQLAAMLAEKPLKVPATSSVSPAFFEKITTREPLIRATLVSGTTVKGRWPFPEFSSAPKTGTPRENLAMAITGPHNRRFAEVMANRVWARLFGMGLVHPVHDWEGRTPSHPALLAWLGRELMLHDYDLRHLCRIIMNSAAWQRRAAEMPEASDAAKRFFTAPLPRRMSAEQLVDTLHATAGRAVHSEPLTFDVDSSQKPENMLHLGQPRRAWEFTSLANERDRPALALPRAQTVTDMLEAFGWRASRPEPLTERTCECTPLQPAMLSNGTLAASLIALCEESRFTHTACRELPLPDLIDSLWLQLLNRPPTAAEQKNAVALLANGYDSRLTGLLAAAPSNKDPDVLYERVSWSNHLRPEATEIKQRVARAVARGPAPTVRLESNWRERCEDLIWSLVNSAEFTAVP
jgi:mono/diheme cytochrome c family protein